MAISHIMMNNKMVNYLLGIELLINQDKSYGDNDDEGCAYIVYQNKVTIQATNISLLKKKTVLHVDRLVQRTILTVGPRTISQLPIILHILYTYTINGYHNNNNNNNNNNIQHIIMNNDFLDKILCMD